MFICCDTMRFELKIDKTIVSYDPTTRQYSIICYESNYGDYQQIIYCPWCSYKLPATLGEEWGEILEKELGITDMNRDIWRKLPQEFKTERWWKKRGL